jgi:hypothetical protein
MARGPFEDAGLCSSFCRQFGEDVFEGYQSFRAFRQVTGHAGEAPPLNLVRSGPDPIHNLEDLRFQANLGAEPGTPR